MSSTSIPSDPPKTLEQILDDLLAPSRPPYPGAVSGKKRIVRKRLQALIEREVIMEDDLQTRGGPLFKPARNELRAEQRLRLSKLIGEGEL